MQFASLALRLSPLLLALLILACDSGENQQLQADATPTVETPRLALHAAVTDAALRERLQAEVARLATDFALRLSFLDPSSPEDEAVVISSTRRPDTRLETEVRYWGAFTGFWNGRSSLTLAALGAEPGLNLLLPEEHRDALAQLLPPTVVQRGAWLKAGEIAARLEANQEAITFLPIEHAGPRLRSLEVDGIDLVRGEGEAAQSPLVERLYLGWSDEALESPARALAQRLRVDPPDPIRLVATGDIIPSRCVYQRQRARNDYAAAFRPTAAYLSAADLTIGSLDASISDAAEPIGCVENFNLMAPARSIEGLKLAGFDVITVATNHIKDCGSLGFCGDRSFLDTLRNLEAAGIRPVGGGPDIAAAHAPVIVTVKGVRFAFLGYDDVAVSELGATRDSPGTASLAEGLMARDIERARREADVVVVMAQWGEEYSVNPTSRQQRFAAEAVEQGATLVVGNHAHVVQAVEWQAGSFIAYALGNFVFDQDWSPETQQGAVLEATFIGSRLVEVRLHPVRIVDMHQATWASPQEARAVLERMRRASQAIAD